MSEIIVTNDNFEKEVLKETKTVLVDFYADWCGPCQMVAPILHEISNENKGIKVVKINVDNNQELAIQFGIMSIPTMLVFKDSKVVNKVVGFHTKEEILNLIK